MWQRPMPILLAGLAAWAPLGPQQSAHYVSGRCFDLVVGAWDTPDAAVLDSLWHAPPARVRFSTLPGQWGYDGFLVQPAPGSVQSPHRFTTWEPLGGDSLAVWWGDGLTGIRGTLAPDEDGGLTGEIRTLTDIAGSPTFRAELRGTPVECDAEPDAPRSAQRYIPRIVELEGGLWLELGRPVLSRENVLGDFNATAYFVRPASVGLFGGSSDVRVRVAVGDTVASVRLSFPEGAFAELRQRLESALGPAVYEDDGPGWEMVGWLNREVAVSVHRAELVNGEESVRVFVHERPPRPWSRPTGR